METPGVSCPPSRDDHSFGTTITITTPPAEDHHSHPHQDGILSPTFYSQATTLVNSLSSPALPQKSNTSTVIHRHYWRVTSACLCFFAIGWGDGATGVVMPQMSKHFQLGYSMGSMLFVIISLGYALMNLVVEPTARILGRFYFDAAHTSPFIPRIFPRKRIVAYSPSKGRCLSLFLFGLFHCAYFLFAAWSPRYYGVLIAFFIGGMGKSVQIAQINGYWANNLRVHGVWFLHASYGFGAFASPLLGQTLRAHGFRWRSFFWISLSIALCNVFLGLYAFKTTDEEFTIERNLALASDALSQTTKKLGMMKDLQEDDYEKGLKPNKSPSSGSKSVWREVMCMPHFWTVAIFLLAYQGAETVAQGFIVTFALHERDANPNKVGYVASGFWAGLALGRIAWGVLSSSFSQRAKIYYMNIAL
ncbi:hypothetical protein FRB91_003610 [Serendipita sp. 411]|nr:hypothetical protein FRB91_003610 [Serendipita sp. 411]